MITASCMALPCPSTASLVLSAMSRATAGRLKKTETNKPAIQRIISIHSMCSDLFQLKVADDTVPAGKYAYSRNTFARASTENDGQFTGCKLVWNCRQQPYGGVPVHPQHQVPVFN